MSSCVLWGEIYKQSRKQPSNRRDGDGKREKAGGPGGEETSGRKAGSLGECATWVFESKLCFKQSVLLAPPNTSGNPAFVFYVPSPVKVWKYIHPVGSTGIKAF